MGRLFDEVIEGKKIGEIGNQVVIKCICSEYHPVQRNRKLGKFFCKCTCFDIFVIGKTPQKLLKKWEENSEKVLEVIDKEIKDD